MINDFYHRFSNEQALGSNAEASTNVYDDGQDRNLGLGEPMGVAINVITGAAVTSGSGTWSFKVETDDDSGFSTPTTICSRDFNGSDLTGGSIHVLPLPTDPACERYLRMLYDMGGNNPTITVSAFLTSLRAVHQWVTYASPVTIA